MRNISEKDKAIIRAIFEAVEYETGIQTEDIMDRNRAPEVDTARLLVIENMIASLPGWSLKSIGRALDGRHHASIIHARRTIRRRMEYDKNFANIAERVLTRLSTPDRFDQWWEQEGSKMSAYVSETPEETFRRVAHIAWLNGEYIAQTCKP